MRTAFKGTANWLALPVMMWPCKNRPGRNWGEGNGEGRKLLSFLLAALDTFRYTATVREPVWALGLMRTICALMGAMS